MKNAALRSPRFAKESDGVDIAGITFGVLERQLARQHNEGLVEVSMKWILAVLAATRLLAGADFALDFLPANTKVMFGVHVPAIAESALFKEAGAQKLSAEWLNVVAITGFDPLHDIDEVLLASPADNEKAAALLVVRGRFNLERLGTGAARYRGVAMVGADKAGKSVLALLDAATAIAGEAPAVRAAIDRRERGAASGGTALDAKLLTRVQALRERFDVWGTGERPEGFVTPADKPQELDSVDRFEFGVRMRQGFELGAEVHARSRKDAEKLAATLASLKAMMNRGEQAGPKLDVQVNDGTVKISLSVSEQELKTLTAQQRARPFMDTPRSGPPTIVGSEPATPPPAGRASGTNVFVLPGKK